MTGTPAGTPADGQPGMGRRGFAAMLAAAAAALPAGTALAQGLAGMARLAGPPALTGGVQGVDLSLPMTQPVPYRLRLLGDPWRVALDLRTLDWTGLPPGLSVPGAVRAVRAGQAGGGWSRLVLELEHPMGIAGAALDTDPASGAARLTLRLVPVDMAEFLRQMAALDGGGARCPNPPRPPVRRWANGPRWWCWTRAMAGSTPARNATGCANPT